MLLFSRRGSASALLLGAVALWSISSAFAGDDPTKKKIGKDPSKIEKPPALKKYTEVVTPGAKTSKGLFLVHRIDDKVYFEIPDAAYGKLMLWTSEIVKAAPGAGWGGKTGARNYIRWERRDNKVLLWQVAFAKRAEDKGGAVEAANHDSIIASFRVEAEGKDKAAVFNATSLYTTDIAELTVKTAVAGSGAIDNERSWLEEVKVFPTNIETRVFLTYRGGGAAPLGIPTKGAPPAGAGGKSVSIVAHYSMVALPDTPMTGRWFDPRVGFFTRSFEDYSSTKPWMMKKEYIARFRLEKKDPTAALSDVVRPITFYLSREIPDKWRPWLKQGVEAWKPAFEKAGFLNAIQCKDAPSRAEDPNWDPEDARWSVIRWVAEPTQNAMGPHVHDPRSGEIISAHIIFWHDIQKLVQQWYFIQCAPLDPRAQKLPLPDEVTGELLRYVSAHEVGHTLGLRHNHRASSAYSIKQLRDPEFTKKHGTVASIMAYGRFNYVAQPEDGVKSLIPVIGPYDYFAIEWGYKGIAGAKSSDAERATLDKWAARQIDEPWLRFGGEDGPSTVDPTVKTENIGDDALEATALGLRNLDRVTDMLLSATTELGEDYSLLQETYKNLLKHRANWLGSVSKLVGGVVENRTLGGRGTETFTRVPVAKQKQAVKFVLEHGLKTPRQLLNPAIVNQFKYYGVADDIADQQRALMESLISPRRFKLLMDAELVGADGAYSPLELLLEVQAGIFSELTGKFEKDRRIDPVRRQLQRAYLDYLHKQLEPKEPAAAKFPLPIGDEIPAPTTSRSTDFAAVAQAGLRHLHTQLSSVIELPTNALTRAHLEECRDTVAEILKLKK